MISLFQYILKQLFTSVSVVSGGYLLIIRILLIIGQRHSRCRAVAPTSNTASHDYHEKSSSQVYDQLANTVSLIQFL